MSERKEIGGRSKRYSGCLFHVLKLHNLPPLFYNYIFYCPLFWERSALTRSKCENSILRKWVYSFKHSGNSRGGHRGPENICVFWQSGLKISELDHSPDKSSKIC